MNWNTNELSSLPPWISPKKFVSTLVIADEEVENVSCRRWSWTSKGRHNFLLQHETSEMGQVEIPDVKQIRGWTTRIVNLHPDSIAFFQVQRRLDGQRTELINGTVILSNKTRPDLIPIQIKIRKKINIRWRCKTRRPREREKINSRLRCREFPRRQIHGISLVHSRQIIRNRSWCFVKIRISLDVEMDGRRFDVGVSDPFLFFCKQKRFRWTISNKIKTWRTILISKKVAVNHFHYLRSFDRKESAQFMSRPLQIRTRDWHFTNVNYFTRSDFQKGNFSFLS